VKLRFFAKLRRFRDSPGLGPVLVKLPVYNNYLATGGLLQHYLKPGGGFCFFLNSKNPSAGYVCSQYKRINPRMALTTISTWAGVVSSAGDADIRFHVLRLRMLNRPERRVDE
jgi:hypothetical protein